MEPEYKILLRIKRKKKTRGKNNGHMYIELKSMQCLWKISWLGDGEKRM